MSGRSDILGLCHCKSLQCISLHCTFNTLLSNVVQIAICTTLHYFTEDRAFVEKCLFRSAVQLCHCFFLMADEHCSMNVWLLFTISQVIASEKIFLKLGTPLSMIHVWVFDNVQKLKLRSKHLKWGFKPLRIYCHNNHNMGNVPMCQLACCIPEIADGAGRDLFSLLTPAPLTYWLPEEAKKTKRYC